MRKPLTLIVYIFAIGLLVALTSVIVLKLLFWPLCTSIGTTNTGCIVDGWSVAGLAATVLGVAAAILALLGAFAVAAWWSDLNKRISEQITNIFKEEKNKLQVSLKEAESLKEERRIELNQYKNIQEELRDKINALGELRKYVELQEAVTKSIEDTNRALMYLVLGNQLVSQKKIAEAIDTYERAKALRPEDPQVNYILGRTYRGISSYDQAITCLETCVEVDSSFVPAHFELGIAYRNHADKLYSAPSDEMKRYEEYEKAIEQIKLAAKLQPNDEEIWGTLGSIYRRAQDYKRALMYYKHARDARPDSSYAVGNIAILAWHEGDRANALEAFRHTEELATKSIDSGLSYEPFWGYYDRGMARLVLGTKKDALSDYRIAIDLTHSPEHFKSVVDGLIFFKEVEDKYPIDGLDDALAMVIKADTEAKARVAGSHIG
jgi:tetratricopeptide (TPR) repeat protein